jgi:hypothetical protein
MMHYKYLRMQYMKTLRTDKIEKSLNQLLTEFAPHLFDPTKKGNQLKPNQPESMIIEVPKPQQPSLPKSAADLDSEDFLLSTLEFVPADYQIMSKSL